MRETRGIYAWDSFLSCWMTWWHVEDIIRAAQFICSHYYFDKMSVDPCIHVFWTMWLGTSVVLDWIPEWFLCCQTRKPYPARHDRRHRCSFTVEFDQVIKLFFCCQQNSCCFSPVFKIASCENFDHLFVLLRRHLLCLQHSFLKPHCPRFCTSSASNVLRTMRIEVVKSVPKCGKCISNATFMKGYVDVWGWLECSSGIFYPWIYGM